MNVVEFVDYIKEQTGKDWQDLCYHLMKTLVAEEKWREEVEQLGETASVSHPLMMITHCAMEMGWDIAIPKEGDGSENVTGLIVGSAEYINSVIKTDQDDQTGSQELPEGE